MQRFSNCFPIFGYQLIHGRTNANAVTSVYGRTGEGVLQLADTYTNLADFTVMSSTAGPWSLL